jgi:hypothetical protein
MAYAIDRRLAWRISTADATAARSFSLDGGLVYGKECSIAAPKIGFPDADSQRSFDLQSNSFPGEVFRLYVLVAVCIIAPLFFNRPA